MESKKITEIIKTEKGEVSGELRVGVIPTIAPYLMPAVITSFLKLYPNVTLQVWEHTTERIIEDLKKGFLDCGLLSSPVSDSAINEMPLFYENFVAYISEDSKLYDKKLVGAEDIADEKLWLLNEGHCMRGQVLNICNYRRNHSSLANFEYNTGSIETLKRMVEINSGVTVLPELSIANYDEDQMEHIRYFKAPEPVREISLVTTYNYVKKQAVASLKAEVLKAVPDKFKTNRKKDIVGFDL
jgi:LysR family hydrogen peroxide-inducible transcriptional activator